MTADVVPVKTTAGRHTSIGYVLFGLVLIGQALLYVYQFYELYESTAASFSGAVFTYIVIVILIAILNIYTAFKLFENPKSTQTLITSLTFLQLAAAVVSFFFGAFAFGHIVFCVVLAGVGTSMSTSSPFLKARK